MSKTRLDDPAHQPRITKKLHPTTKRRWLNALRDGQYKQGIGALYASDTGRFCCLGVLGDLCRIPRASMSGLYLLDESVTARRWLGPVYDDPHTTVQQFLAQANDAGVSFRRIATWIEKHL